MAVSRTYVTAYTKRKVFLRKNVGTSTDGFVRWNASSRLEFRTYRFKVIKKLRRSEKTKKQREEEEVSESVAVGTDIIYQIRHARLLLVECVKLKRQDAMLVKRPPQSERDEAGCQVFLSSLVHFSS